MSLPPETSAKFSGSYLLYASTIFLSAFLLFAIQPIAGKHLLPWFGGSSSVWATSLLFFTGMLFLGYLYVYLLTRFAGRRQSFIHACVLAAASISALLSLFVWHSLFPPFVQTAGNVTPSLDVLMALLIAIGVPYFLLSTTGPLLQYWYGISAEREPYKLYALSNIGSLLALLSYPFLIEPFISLPHEESIWLGLFLLFALVCGSVCLLHLSASRGGAEARPIESEAVGTTSTWRLAVWIGLAALPSFMLVATTTQITQVIAPMPLLWVVPLALYLVTFILAFRGWGQSIYLPLLLLAATFLAYHYNPFDPDNVVVQISSSVFLMFVCGLFCHAQLYRLRPETGQLPLFYLLLSFGGMLGALCVSLLAPLVSPLFWEFPLGIALCAALAAWALAEDFFPRILDSDTIVLTKVVFCCGVVALFTNLITTDDGTPSIISRNFYGPAQVRFHDDLTSLQHGGTLHGVQLTAKEMLYVPTSYYVSGSGIGRAILYEQGARRGEGLRIGVLGLGTGSLASHCRSEDTFVFYEIDPRIESIARKHFSYLAHCTGSEVRIGDGRLLLETERSAGNLGGYDVLVMDAFSDDTVPAHLLTLQAVSLYLSHLRGADSIIAIHTSNRYLNLPPVMLRIAAELGLNAMIVQDSGESSPWGSQSLWVLLTEDPKVFGARAFVSANSWLPDSSSAPLWTDDFTSLFSVIDLPLPWK